MFFNLKFSDVKGVFKLKTIFKKKHVWVVPRPRVGRHEPSQARAGTACWQGISSTLQVDVVRSASEICPCDEIVLDFEHLRRIVWGCQGWCFNGPR
jgi:hypothetical protein